MAYLMGVHSNMTYRYLPKLTEYHVEETLIPKMKVSIVRRVYSRSMSKFIELAAKFDGPLITSVGPLKMEKGAIHSSNFFDFSDQRFDSCNARRLKPLQDKPLTQVVTGDTAHLKFWAEAVKKLENMRFVSKDKLEHHADPPSLVHWRYNLKAFPELWKTLKTKGFEYMKTRYVNQDPIENLFGAIRSHGGRYTTLSCYQTEGIIKALLIFSFSFKHSIGANCLDDGAKAFGSLELFSTSKNTNAENFGVKSHEFDETPRPEKAHAEIRSASGMAVRIQCAGDFAKRLFSKCKEAEK